MTINSIEQLLSVESSEISLNSFDNEFWDNPKKIREHVLEFCHKNPASINGIIKKLPRLLEVFGFEFELINGSISSKNTQEIFGILWDKKPSPFIAFSLFLSPISCFDCKLTEYEFNILISFCAIYLEAICNSKDNYIYLYFYLIDLCNALSRFAELEKALFLAETAVSIVESKVNFECSVLYIFYSYFYDSKVKCLNIQSIIKSSERKIKAIEMLDFIDNRLTPLMEKVNEQIKTSSLVNKNIIISRDVLINEHRRLTWETTKNASENKWPPGTTQRWKKISDRYLSYKIETDSVNSILSLSTAMERLFDVVERSNINAFKDELCFLADNIVCKIDSVTWNIQSTYRSVLRNLINTFILLNRKDDAKKYIKKASDSICIELGEADRYQKSLILSTADDFLGLCLKIYNSDSCEFKELYKVIRSEDLVNTSRRLSTIQCFVTRQGSGLRYLKNNKDRSIFSKGRNSHDLALILDNIKIIIDKEEKLLREKNALNTDKDWIELIEKLSRNIGINRLKNKSQLSQKLLIETDGLAVHLSIPGLFVNKFNNISGIAITPLGYISKPQAIPNKAQAILLNCVDWKDQMSSQIGSICQVLGLTSFNRIESKEQFVSKIKQEASLVVIGAHGVQDGVAGPFSILIEKNLFPLSELFDDFTFSSGVTVVLLICFSGSGQLHERWQSLPGYLLNSGARWVVANRWPVWLDDKTKDKTNSFLRSLLEASISTDPWEVAYKTTDFMKELRRIESNPRKWIGWGAWTTRGLLESTENVESKSSL